MKTARLLDLSCSLAFTVTLLLAHSYALGQACSRASFVRFTTDENAATVGACLAQAFEYFGGVPREVLFDNAKSVIIARDAYGVGWHRFHAGLLDVANAYGFTPRVCRPYRARTKGKVERFNRYLRDGFYVPLRSRLQSVGLLLDAGTANIEAPCKSVQLAKSDNSASLAVLGRLA